METIDDLLILNHPLFFGCITKDWTAFRQISYNNTSIKYAVEVPMTWSSHTILFLCKDAIDSAPRDCALGKVASQLVLTSIVRAILCHGMSYSKDKSVTLYLNHHEAPMKCMHLIQTIFGTEEGLSTYARR